MRLDPTRWRELVSARATRRVGFALVALLLLTQAVRVAAGLREVRSLDAAVQRLEAATTAAARASARLGEGGDAPGPSQPSSAVRSLVRTLEATGIRSYAYRLVAAAPIGTDAAAAPLDPGVAPVVVSPEGEDPIDLFESWSTQAPPELPLEPDERGFTVVLSARATGAALDAFLRALDREPFAWFVRRAHLERGDGVTATFLLQTAGRLPQLATSDGSDPEFASADESAASVGDPFHTRARASGAGPRRDPPAPPSIGGVTLAPLRAAWLDGVLVPEGASSGEWTVESVGVRSVGLRHTSGRVVLRSRSARGWNGEG